MASGSGALVSVALPVREAGPHLASALGSVLGQTYGNLDVMVIVNPGDGATADRVRGLGGGDARVRVLERPRRGLAAALNFALAEARSDLVARMDADDWSAPERIAVQVAALERDPGLAAIGSAYAVVDAATGEEIERVFPPTRPEEARWRVMVGNVFAHGSMVLRRGAVVEAGGYDESVERGQDYALWVRMCGVGMRMGNVPEVVYRHRMARDRRGIGAGDDAQAAAAGSAMVDAWTGMGSTSRRSEIESAVAGVMRTVITFLASVD